jgi:hypothetical protein
VTRQEQVACSWDPAAAPEAGRGALIAIQVPIESRTARQKGIVHRDAESLNLMLTVDRLCVHFQRQLSPPRKFFRAIVVLPAGFRLPPQRRGEMKFTACMAMAIVPTGAWAQEDHRMFEALNNAAVIRAMKRAWVQTGNGTTLFEASFRLDGNLSDYEVVATPRSNEMMKQKVWIVPGKTFAVFHVHPRTKVPTPSPNDMRIADKHKIKVYTMHSEGLYEYDPVTKTATKLRDGLDWMTPVNRQIARTPASTAPWGSSFLPEGGGSSGAGGGDASTAPSGSGFLPRSFSRGTSTNGFLH